MESSIDVAAATAAPPSPPVDEVRHAAHPPPGAPSIKDYRPPKYEEHPAGEEIRTQVEFYFSDENLPTDAHLLVKTGCSQNLPVSIKHICGFAKMRKYKPYRSVVESLKKSTTLNVVDNKFLQRKVPLSIKPSVDPDKFKEASFEEKQTQAKKQILKEQPWMTKGMLKPSGFEEYFTDAPITPEVFQEERTLYDTDISFETRIETAIQRYRARRKFHQEIAKAFGRFMNFGGIDSGPKAYGGSDQKELKDKDASEIAALTAIDFVSNDVTSTNNWDVDFEGVAKGFLSCHIMPHLSGDKAQTEVARTTNIMRNFYNYLLYHNVCPEYEGQILAARKVVDLADMELFNVVKANEKLAGPFNQAVSTLHNGALAGVYSDEQDWEGAALAHRSLQECREIVKFALSAYGTEMQYQKVSEIGGLQTVYTEQMSMEVTGVEMADDETRALYTEAREKKPFLSALGKLHCRRWTYPNAPKFEHSEEALRRQQTEHTSTFWVEEDILRYCFAGMKIEGEVRELDIGVKWLDSIRAVSASFFEFLPNELFGAQKAIRAEEAAARKVADRNVSGLDAIEAQAQAQAEALPNPATEASPEEVAIEA